MSIEILGNEENPSDLKYCCNIQIADSHYTGFVVSKHYEYDIQYDGRNLYSARYKDISKLNIFLNRLTLSFDDSENDLFKICSSGIRGTLGFGRDIQVRGLQLKIPKKFSFSLPEIGYEIEMKRSKFKSSIRNRNDLGIGIGLSYFIWLQQQRWINTD